MRKKLGVSGLSLLLVVLLHSCGGGGPQTPSPPPPPPPPPPPSTPLTIPSTFFGMCVGDPVNTWPTIKFGALGHDPRVGWAPRESQKGSFNFTDIDNYVSAAQAHGIDDMIYDLGGNTPSWAGPSLSSPPTNIADWDDYVNAMVSRYKGQIKYYEIWNEANVSFSGTPADMVELAMHAFNDIKGIDPNAQVLTPSTTGPAGEPWNWLKSFLEAGGSKYADIGTFHGYVATVGTTPYPFPEQESTSGCNPPPPGPNSNCTGSVMTKFRNFRSVLDNNGMAGKPLFDTEGGWGQNANVTDPDLRVAFLARWFILQASVGVARADWFAYGIPYSNTGTGSRNWGSLLDTTGAMTPAGTAYGILFDWLAGATISTPCAVGADGTTWTCGLTRSANTSYQGQLAWNTAGDTSYTPASQFIQYRDLAGNKVSASGSVTIGMKPLLFENQNP